LFHAFESFVLSLGECCFSKQIAESAKVRNLIGATPLCCSTNQNIVQSKHKSIFNLTERYFD